MKKIKLTKILKLSLALAVATSIPLGLAACGEETGTQEVKEITVISREDGSGTRNAFVELTGVMEDSKDRTTDKAEVSNSNAVVIQSVMSNEGAIGYVSMGTVPSEVKILKINGIEGTAENVSSEQYELQRPFNIVTIGEQDELSQDFMDFILSDNGQKIIEKEGYIPVNAAKSVEPSTIEATPYATKNLDGTITIAGSTSVAPVMEILAEEYEDLNDDVDIEIQQTGSGAGIQSLIQGATDIAMSSRDLTQDEYVEGITSTRIALDGIAVIVNKTNKTDNLTKEELKKIFTGEITDWSEFHQSDDDK